MTTTQPVHLTSGSNPALSARIVVGGVSSDSGSAGVFEHHDPARGKVNALVPLGGPADIDRAVEAAREGQKLWRTTSPKRRRDLLLALADELAARRETLAAIAGQENGLPRRGFEARMSNALDWTRYYAGWADKIGGQLTAAHPAEHMEYVLNEPYGVVAIIITWNSPMISLAMKVPAALAAGNSVVIKPSEITPFTTTVFAEAVEAAGFPPGVVNVVPGGVAAGEALVVHPHVGKISFTGGIKAARAMMVAGAPLLKPFCFELGGKSANLIFPDADLDVATASVTRSLGNAGQSCKLPSRLLVHADVYDDYVGKLKDGLAGLRIGDPADPDTIVGPLVNEAARDRVLALIEDTAGSGAGRLTLGGGKPELPAEFRDGYFVEPTLFEDVDPSSVLAQDEVFGPVLAVMRFSTEEEAVELANSTPWGLSSYIQSRDLGRVHRVAAQLEAGTVHVNGSNLANSAMPFGGYGISGLGREGGRAGLDEFLRPKSVSLP